MFVNFWLVQPETSDHVSGTSALHPTLEESVHRQHCGLAPRAANEQGFLLLVFYARRP